MLTNPAARPAPSVHFDQYSALRLHSARPGSARADEAHRLEPQSRPRPRLACIGRRHPLVEISPSDSVTRRVVNWHGLTVELVQATRSARTEFRFRAPVHLLVVFEDASREDGETSVEGLPRSTLRNLTRKLTFIPAGHDYYEWHKSRAVTRLMYIYLDPGALDVAPDPELADIAFGPRLFFEDAALWESALKLKRAIEHPGSSNQNYFDALGVILMHELARAQRAPAPAAPLIKGGLALHHQRIVSTYIDEHLADQIPLAALAELAHLSPFHFCRAFKQSFGMPPHRYHTSRRIERAKAMLAERGTSVTEIGSALGFCETSSFCSAFRKATGLTPREYRHNVG